jgi:hypothetical protein
MTFQTRTDKGVIDMAKFFSTDKIIAIGLVVALIISFFTNSTTELQATIVGGLVGYLSHNNNNTDVKKIIADELAQKAISKVLPDKK